MSPVVSLALATLAFVGTHLAMSHPFRAALVARLGARGFLGAYSLVSALTLGWMILAWWQTAGPSPLWVAPLWWWPFASALMLVASILLVGSLIRNPAFPEAGNKGTIGPARGVFAITRHPMNSSFILWALVHISLSGSARNLIVAGGILILALAGSLGQDAKKARLIGGSWRDWQARTSFMPFAALLDGRTTWRAAFPGWFALIGGTIFWALLTSWHAPLVSPLGDLLSR
ncbi:MAG: MFS transporter [Sphingomonas sp.]|nr:MFS transporter [Sphingomonas sp.]